MASLVGLGSRPYCDSHSTHWRFTMTLRIAPSEIDGIILAYFGV